MLDNDPDDPLVPFVVEIPKSTADAYAQFSMEHGVDISIILRGMLHIAACHSEEANALLLGLALGAYGKQ